MVRIRWEIGLQILGAAALLAGLSARTDQSSVKPEQKTEAALSSEKSSKKI
ncbi:hypothetical protein [Niallia endozanthoxylica]|uniref:hypothetical protein n=1 Tax=Niallia endozanthoxylica TaxID=2036016 RepID=UPI00168AAF0A|nr:hypothetical protein [Niallia endozanthoxylica]